MYEHTFQTLRASNEARVNKWASAHRNGNNSQKVLESFSRLADLLEQSEAAAVADLISFAEGDQQMLHKSLDFDSNLKQFVASKDDLKRKRCAEFVFDKLFLDYKKALLIIDQQFIVKKIKEEEEISFLDEELSDDPAIDYPGIFYDQLLEDVEIPGIYGSSVDLFEGQDWKINYRLSRPKNIDLHIEDLFKNFEGDKASYEGLMEPGAYAIYGGPSAGKTRTLESIELSLAQRNKSYKKLILLEPGSQGKAYMTKSGILQALSSAFLSDTDVILIDSFRFSAALTKGVILAKGIPAAIFNLATTLSIIAERSQKVVFFVVSTESEDNEISKVYHDRLLGSCNGVFAPQYSSVKVLSSLRYKNRGYFTATPEQLDDDIQVRDRNEVYDAINQLFNPGMGKVSESKIGDDDLNNLKQIKMI